MTRANLRARILYRFSAGLRCRLIRNEGRPYLERYFVGRLLGITVFLHRFLASDGDREVHDHPWRWSFAWVLTGGYREERMRHLDPERGWASDLRSIRAGRINALGARSFHRVLEPQPETWTVFVHGPRIKRWGFLEAVPEGAGATYRPAAVASGGDWKHTAPRGRDAGREPLAGRQA